MILSHKIQLNPNNKQANYFAQASGCARLAYNWGLNEWKKQYEIGEKPNIFALRRQFNEIKKREFPFVLNVSKCAPQQALIDLGQSFTNFFHSIKQGRKPGFPRFKRKGIHDSFYLDNLNFAVNGKKIRIPKLGWVRMTEKLRFAGKIMSATVSKTAGKWFVSIPVKVPDGPECSDNQVYSAVGVDLGIKHLATLSDGTVFENPKSTRKYENKIRRLSKSLSRKVKGSSNWKKAKAKLAKAYYKIVCTRKDVLHKLTHFLVSNYSHICIEDLNVKGMIKNHCLAKAVLDCGFGEFRRQLSYKALHVQIIDRFFPSSKMCSHCGQIHDMPLSKRTMKCDCGLVLDRDLNAAKNILTEGIRQVLPNFKPVEMEALTACCLGGETTICEAGNNCDC